MVSKHINQYKKKLKGTLVFLPMKTPVIKTLPESIIRYINYELSTQHDKLIMIHEKLKSEGVTMFESSKNIWTIDPVKLTSGVCEFIMEIVLQHKLAIQRDQESRLITGRAISTTSVLPTANVFSLPVSMVNPQQLKIINNELTKPYYGEVNPTVSKRKSTIVGKYVAKGTVIPCIKNEKT